MKRHILNEINQMKFLFDYKPGKVISEQDTSMRETFEDYEDFLDHIDLGPDVAPTPTRERERTREKERERIIKPRRERPSRNPDDLPGVDPHPQGEDETEYELVLNMPKKDEIADRPNHFRQGTSNFDSDNEDVEYELEIEDMPRRRRMPSDETEYELHLDGDIEDLFT